MRRCLLVFLLGCLPGVAQQVPIATALAGNPFFIKKTWFIGGAGNWDSLAVDPEARRLYIAHSRSVQVVDLDSGSIVGEIGGFREARAIALDNTGSYGYITDGPAASVRVVNRLTLQVESTIPIGCSPRSIVFDSPSRLVFAFCGADSRLPQPAKVNPHDYTVLSLVVAIDAEKNAVLADMVLNGDFRIAQADGNGNIYASVAHPAWLAELDATGIGQEARRRLNSSPGAAAKGPVHFDWSYDRESSDLLHHIPLHSSCREPQGIAVNGRNQRLFVACENQSLQVLKASTGETVAALTTGPGDDIIGYDPDHALIFVANGAGYGSLTIISEDVNTDSYQVVQNLPTRERARSLTVDPSRDEVYLVTDIHGVDLTSPGSIGTMRTVPVDGSFHVLVIGH